MLPVSKCFWQQVIYLQRTSEGPRRGMWASRPTRKILKKDLRKPFWEGRDRATV